MTDTRPLAPRDKKAWETLFNEYAAFYDTAMTAKTSKAVWAWLMDAANPLHGIAATQGGVLVGVAHWRTAPHTLSGGQVVWLDDLFTSPEARSGGVGKVLVDAVLAETRALGGVKMRLITQRYNARGRRLYDRYALASPFLMYNFDPSANAD